MTAADFDYIRAYVRDQAAIKLEPGKEYLVESRLQTLARKENLATVDMLMLKLRGEIPAQSPLHRKVVDVMTTNETSFYRDLHPFEMLKREVIPDLMRRRAAERQISIWCGASSTGQEPFSVLMLLAEHFPDLMKWDIKFIATDLCTEVLARAKAGRFSQLEVNRGLPATLLVKYFTQVGGEWEFKADLRKRVTFQELNLVKEWPPLPLFDIVFLRNVLIYFDVVTKRTILGKIRRLLRPGGSLFLGGAETTVGVDDNFQRIAIEKATCYRLTSAG